MLTYILIYLAIGVLWVALAHLRHGPMKPIELVLANIAFWPIIIPLSIIASLYDRRRDPPDWGS